jgi:4-hydroxybutyryl-CoA dehydratase/vinylacetyl-CoA-Delta-isomerase
MRAKTAGGETVNRMIAIPRDASDLLDKLEAVRLVCQETGCAQRYLGGDGLAGVFQATHRLDVELGGDYHPRLLDYLRHVYENDLTLGLAMTDAKGVRSLRPHAQPNLDAYLRIVERNAKGITISGVKAIVTGAPYVRELLVMPGRAMTEADRDFAVCCAVPVDAPGLTIVARPAGRATPPPNSAASTGNRPGFVCSTRCSCLGSGCSWPASGDIPSTSPTATRPIIAIPASARGPVSAIC